MKNDINSLLDQRAKVRGNMEAAVAKLKSGTVTEEEFKKFDLWDKEFNLLNIAIKRAQEEEQEFANKIATHENEVSGFDRRILNSNNPIFNRHSKISLGQWYRKNNNVSENMEGMTFGDLAKAYLIGPQNDREARALSEGTNSAGGYTVPQSIAVDIIDMARKKSHLLNLGMNIVPMEDGKKSSHSMAKLLTGVNAQWRAENIEITDGDPTFGSVSWAFKTLGALVIVSNELLQDSLNIVDALNMEFTKSFSDELDRVGLVGSGSGAEPKGISQYSNVNVYEMAANGAAISNFSPILQAIQLIREDNHEPNGLIMSPRTLATIDDLRDEIEQPMRRPFSLENLPFLQTTKIGNADTQGSSSNASKIIMGDFSKLYLGVRLNLQIIPLKERFAEFNQTGFLAVMRADIKPYHEEAFGMVKGIVPVTPT